MKTVAFTKMHGLGNDFVVIDARQSGVVLNDARVKRIADRKRGIGCDQLIVIRTSEQADCFMQIFNADGSEVAACGNASRCVPVFLGRTNGETRIETKAGILSAYPAHEGEITVDMGRARLAWQEIPLTTKMDTLHLTASVGPLTDAVGVSMGNPHAVFFVENTESVDLETYGPKLEHHPLFPERANIGVAQVLSRDAIRLRVWERGAGETQACGTGACAALVAAVRRGLTDHEAMLHLTGGDLRIHWREGDGQVLMTGPAQTSFSGVIDFSVWGKDEPIESVSVR
jgi:diaminopimelate epimerase